MSGTSKARIDPDGEEREGRMPMQLADFPRWLRALFAVFLILFFFNALYAWRFLQRYGICELIPGSPPLWAPSSGLELSLGRRGLDLRTLFGLSNTGRTLRLKRASISTRWTLSGKLGALMKSGASCWLR